MKERWLIALDLDGTLLKKDHTIGEATKKSLAHAAQQGHIVAIATGRPLRAALQTYSELQLTTPLIALNGAFIMFPDKSPMMTSTISEHTANEISIMAKNLGSQSIVAELGTHCVIFQGDQMFALNEEQSQFFYKAVVAETADYPPVFLSIEDTLPAAPHSLLIHLPRDHHANIKYSIEKQWPEQLFIRSWREPFEVLEIMPMGISKATGLKSIIDHYGISRDHTLVFGDEVNDVEMFKFSAISVAMGNANPELLPYADFVTDSCDDEGIAKYLDQHFFHQMNSHTIQSQNMHKINVIPDR